MQSLKNLPQTMLPPKPMLDSFANQKTCQLSPLNMCKGEKSGIDSLYA